MLKGLFNRSRISPAEYVGQLFNSYIGESGAPSREEWEQLCFRQGFYSEEVILLEFVRFSSEENKKAYDGYLAAVEPVMERFKGKIIAINDTLTTGVGDMEHKDYTIGTAFFAKFPSTEAYVKTVLTEEFREAHRIKLRVASEISTLLGKDTIPKAMKHIMRRKKADEVVTTNVEGKSPQELLEALLRIYPDGGADPTRRQLERMLTYAGYADTPLQYINLYKHRPDRQTHDAQAHRDYNRQAMSVVAKRGVYPYCRCEVVHVLAGEVKWDLFILPLWPSFKVCTDLRLDKDYIEAQKHRVDSAELYGNIISTPRKR